jgi:hypothetical protein
LPRLDDLFLGIGAFLLVQTFIVGSVIVGWVDDLNAAFADDNFVWLLENEGRIIKYWYSTSATYIFSIVQIQFLSSS